MRHIIYGINLTLDGCCDHTQMSGSDEMVDYFTDLMQDVDLIIYGRTTYELMVPYWPDVAKAQSGTKAENRFAQTFDAIDKIVCSTSLQDVPGNTRIIRTNLAEEIRQLKQQPGKNISIGGVSLPSELIWLGLVDEYYFLVHPVLSGEGRRLLDGISIPGQLQLKLADSRTLPSGAIALHYVK
ncbi:MAG: dihydrofolate reductase family protein [Chitinophaga sp.]|uniref:dihydrofolate reductase family protein n=1 Tax=Chitinophaga sp. TaxID=1869181 RepID=UPI001B1AC55D|nr:dihydrofolate reductase family protein [Chitinophaga sp.]MBO9728280.1 dihydrofolate reductase family protein [Chitinophaga sp.]